ncbi:MAG TPA: hypothetical protein VJZ91_07880 [Blastocatellia bacterium]|nr:hypothetical protein [Blastocatellia bacterium]
MLARLIAAIASEIEAERAAAAPSGELLREMEDAIAELRLSRGVRLMMLNAYNVEPGSEARRHGRATQSHDAIEWPRAGRRVA